MNDDLEQARMRLEKCSQSREHQCFRLKPEIRGRQMWCESWILEVKEQTIAFLPAPSPFDELDAKLFAEFEVKISTLR